MIDKAITNAIIAVIVFIAGLAVGAMWQKGKHDDYVREQKEAVRAIDAENEARLAASARAWAETVDWLTKQAADTGAEHDRYRRAVAAGRIGPAAHCVQPGGGQAEAVPPAPGADAAGAGPVPATTGEATDVCQAAVAPLIDDFIRAVAQANALMADIEAQPDY